MNKNTFKIIKVRKQKDGTYLIFSDISNKIKKDVYRAALLDETITVKDILFQQKNCKDSIKSAFIATKLVKLLQNYVKESNISKE